MSTEKISDAELGLEAGGYRLIADSDLRNSRAKCYHKAAFGDFIIILDGERIGPLSKDQMKAICHVTSDIESMAGKYLYLE